MRGQTPLAPGIGAAARNQPLRVALLSTSQVRGVSPIPRSTNGVPACCFRLAGIPLATAVTRSDYFTVHSFESLDFASASARLAREAQRRQLNAFVFFFFCVFFFLST